MQGGKHGKKKEEYIKKSMGLSKEKFLEYGFSIVYHLIAIIG